MWLIILILILLCCIAIRGASEHVIYYAPEPGYNFFHEYLISEHLRRKCRDPHHMKMININFFIDGGKFKSNEFTDKYAIDAIPTTSVRWKTTYFPGSKSMRITLPYRHRKYPIPLQDAFPAFIRMKTLMNLKNGNQASLFSNEHMNSLISEGFNLEVFGSSYNTRMRYFGSLYPEDEPYGRIGTAEEILQQILDRKQLRWRNEMIEAKKFTVSPPSGWELIKRVVKLCCSIIESQETYIILALPAKDFHCDILKEYKFCSHWESKTIGYFLDGSQINLSRTPWIDFHLKSE